VEKELIILTDIVANKLGDGATLAYMEWSRNENRAMKPEDEDEKIVLWTRLLMRYDEEDEKEYQKLLETDQDALRMSTGYDQQLAKTKEVAKNEGSKYSAIFSSPHCIQYIRTLLSIASHFRHSKLLKLSGLQRMTDGAGGVSLFR
jgi:hypothetical protein